MIVEPFFACKKPFECLLEANCPSGILLRRLARAEGKALSRSQVNAPLLFSEESLHRTLRSLNRRGLVHMKVSPLFRQQFFLSEAGRRYAIEQDYIVRLHQGKK